MLAVFLVGCGDSEDAATPGGGSSSSGGGSGAGGGETSEPAILPFDPSTAGTIAGHVRANGLQPPREVIKMTGDAFCHGAGEDGTYLDDRVLVGEGNGLANAFVWIETGLERWEYPEPQGEKVMDQVGCLYTPRIFGMRTGQQLTVKTSDETMHNVHIKPDNNKPSNWGMPANANPRTTKFKRAEVMIEVKCDVHAWMKGWIGVLDHPCFAVTAADGSYTLRDVPPGNYTVGVWHEALGEKRFEIEVTARQAAAAVDVTLEL